MRIVWDIAQTQRRGRSDKGDTMRIYEELTESPETLGTFLKSLPVLDAPWDTAFQKTFCGECKEESCDNCPNGKYRNNPEWWLKLKAERDRK